MFASPRTKVSRLHALAFLLAVPVCMMAQKGDGSTASNTVLKVSFANDGTYTVNDLSTGRKLEGKLPGAKGHSMRGKGTDKLGKFHSVAMEFGDGARRAEVRVYEGRPVAEFRDEWIAAGANTTPFPTFQQIPADLQRLSFQTINFGFYQFGKLNPEGPWVLFDKAGNTLVISPADHFLVSKATQDDSGAAVIGIDPTIASMPAGFVHSTLLTSGAGINHAFTDWGSALLALGGKQPAPNTADVTLNKLGYWTDNKTVYYYKFPQDLGYAGTLLAVRDEFKRLNVPLGYMQLDSWFYDKGPLSHWETKGNTPEFGETEYRADKTLFPDGLKKFQQDLGLPMVTHARWIAPQSPYRQQYKVSGNVSIDPAFWQSTADYLHNSDVVTYEQDWLDDNAHADTNLNDPDAFLREMNSAMQAKGMSIQYCMPLPSDYMASSLYPAVQTIRTSGDGFERRKWDEFLYDSALAHAVGLWPWTDAFFSKDLGNLVISTLSAGPVGVGDGIGDFNVKNLMSVVRGDATIIKPDTSLLPIDDAYLHDANGDKAPMVATASTATANGEVLYVFAYPRDKTATEGSVSLKKLGVTKPVVAYNWRTHQAQLLQPGDDLSLVFQDGWSYTVLSPVTAEGVALLGDTEKITPMGRARLTVVQGSKVAVSFAAGETSRPLTGYSLRRPSISAIEGHADHMEYDENDHLFTLQVSPGTQQQAVLKITTR